MGAKTAAIGALLLAIIFVVACVAWGLTKILPILVIAGIIFLLLWYDIW